MDKDYKKHYSIGEDRKLNIENLESVDRDRAMGRYMGAFSDLEMIIKLVISKILNIEIASLATVLAVLQTRQLIDVLDASAKSQLSEAGQSRVHQICEKLKRRNMRRNHIVHGHWVVMVTVRDETAEQEWVRTYQTPDPVLEARLHTDEKRAGMYSFTIPELDRATDHVEEIRKILSGLYGELPSLRSQPLAAPISVEE